MARTVEIEDLALPELDVYARLTESERRSREGVFIAESGKVICAALDAGCRPVSLLMERRHITGKARDIVARCGDVPVYTADEDVLEKLTGFRLSRGILCAMARPRPMDGAAVCAGARRVAVLENVTDATNIGAIFRSAAALGMDGVLLTPDCCDPLTRRAARVSMGTVFQVPWAVLHSWPEDMEKLRALGFRTVAMALRPEAVDIDDARLAGEARLAVILGAEGDGLAPATVAACDYAARIPMKNGVDSLNVAAAGAVAFWQLRVR